MSDEQTQRDRYMILEQQAHEARLAMIQRGMIPSAELPGQRSRNVEGAYKTLTTIGILPPIFAWLSAQPLAWIAVGVIGVACASGAVIIYLKSIQP